MAWISELWREAEASQYINILEYMAAFVSAYASFLSFFFLERLQAG